jgi:hypothetical protein
MSAPDLLLKLQCRLEGQQLHKGFSEQLTHVADHAYSKPQLVTPALSLSVLRPAGHHA